MSDVYTVDIVIHQPDGFDEHTANVLLRRPGDPGPAGPILVRWHDGWYASTVDVRAAVPDIADASGIAAATLTRLAVRLARNAGVRAGSIRTTDHRPGGAALVRVYDFDERGDLIRRT